MPMSAVIQIRREPLTREDHHDRWLAAREEFLRLLDEASKETMLTRYAAFYRSLCGSSVGLDAELEKLERNADRMIEAERVRRGEG